MADWIDSLPTQQTATIKERAVSLFRLQGGGTRPGAKDVAIAAAISAMGAVLILVLLRPPICVYKSQKEEAYYAPSLKVYSLIGWAIAAALVTIFLCLI